MRGWALRGPGEKRHSDELRSLLSVLRFGENPGMREQTRQLFARQSGLLRGWDAAR
jgi:hypothetical protein